MTAEVEAFYERTRDLFHPGGPGRVAIDLSDAELSELERVFHTVADEDRSAVDGALYVVPTPAGVVAIRRKPEPLRAQQIWRSRHARRDRVVVDPRVGVVITRDLDRPMRDQGLGQQTTTGFIRQHYLIYDPWTGFDAGD